MLHSKQHFLLGLVMAVAILIIAVVLGVVGSSHSPLPAVAGITGEVQMNANGNAGTSTLLISGVSQTLIATNTARLYTRVSNLSAVTIYLGANLGAPAIPYQGIPLFASSSIVFDGSNQYIGTITAISPSGNASTTVYEGLNTLPIH